MNDDYTSYEKIALRTSDTHVVLVTLTLLYGLIYLGDVDFTLKYTIILMFGISLVWASVRMYVGDKQ